MAQVNAYLDVALDQEIQRITLIDGPAVLGPEPEFPPTSSRATLPCGCSSPRAIDHGQIVDLDPDVLAHLIGGLALQGGLLIARASDPDGTRAALGQALEAMLRGLAPGVTQGFRHP